MKEIIFIGNYGVEYTALVVGCEEDIGVTVIDKNDKDKYLLCSIGPSSPLWTNKYNGREDESRRLFNILSTSIENGKIDIREILNNNKDLPKDAGNPSSDNCSFAQ